MATLTTESTHTLILNKDEKNALTTLLGNMTHEQWTKILNKSYSDPVALRLCDVLMDVFNALQKE